MNTTAENNPKGSTSTLWQPRGAGLEVVGLTSGYGHTTVVWDVNITVPASTVTALLGSNGAGKTTLLKTLAGLIRPTGGEVRLAGEDITRLSPHRREALGLCLIPEGRGIFRSLTVKENLVLQSRPGNEAESVEKAIEAFPILGRRLQQIAGTMSGGQQQMLAVAPAYTRGPKLILMDEASLGLAPIVVDEIFSFIEKVRDAGAALLLVDQFVTRALQMAETAYVLRRGEVVFSGEATELLEEDIFEQYLGTTSSGRQI